MAATTLVDNRLEAGRDVVAVLERAGFDIDCALWLQDDETEAWALVVASTSVETSGARPIYDAFVRSYSTEQQEASGIDRFEVLPTSSQLIRDLKRLVRTGNKLQKLRIDGITLSGTMYRTSRIYRVKGGTLDAGARVMVKATKQMGSIRKVTDLSAERPYLVMLDAPMRSNMPLTPEGPAGQNFSATELELEYVVSQ
ncbi:MAG: hypothetical protein U0821_23260 [Chloroflexota bacterium]